MEENKKHILWMTDVNTMLEVYQLAKDRGKKAGDSVQDEFIEIMEKKQDKFKILGVTDKDIDILAGELRDRKMKILNLKEIDRQQKLKEENENK